MSVLAGVSREAARRFPDRVALVSGRRSITYAELDVLADRAAAGLAARGVRAGDLVVLLLPNGPDYVVTYLALARLHAVATGVNPRYTDAERAAVLERADAALVLTEDDLPQEWPQATPPDPGPAHDDLVETVVFTSGTTGTPKGAVFTSRQIRAITEMDTGGVWGEGGPQLVATPLPHIGFMTKLAGHLKSGSTMHLLARWRAADALRLIAEERIPYVGGVAAQISLLLRQPEFDDYDFSHVKGLIVGAGPSPAAVVREARERFGAGYSIRYSSTESGGLGTLTAFDAPEDEALHTVGRPRPGTELQIRDPETGEVLPAGTTGQICLRSPAVMDRYWNDPEATAVALDAERWLRTGDLGRIGEDGCLRITGRISEMYIRGGFNVYPLEVEGVLLEHPAVASVAVVPRPDPVMGEIGVAVVVPMPGVDPPTLDDLRSFAADRLAPHKLPEAIRVVDELPLTKMEKLDRRALAHSEADT